MIKHCNIGILPIFAILPPFTVEVNNKIKKNLFFALFYVAVLGNLTHLKGVCQCTNYLKFEIFLFFFVIQSTTFLKL